MFRILRLACLHTIRFLSGITTDVSIQRLPRYTETFSGALPLRASQNLTQISMLIAPTELRQSMRPHGRKQVFRRLLMLVALLPSLAYSQVAPTGFVVENAFPSTSFTLPVAIVFLPDGRKFVVEKEGRVWTIAANGVMLPTPFIDLRTKVLSNDDRGLHGVVLDPDFATNRWVYMLYVVDPDSDGVDTNIAAYARLERYQASATNPDVADTTTRQILIGRGWTDGIPEPPLDRHHMVGTLRFGRDKTLFVGSGDAANASYMDPGGTDPPGTYGPGKLDPAQNLGAFRAQTLNSMDGKILRVDKETGRGLSSNPYWDGNPTSSRSRVWVYGLRNPFRFSVRPGTGSTDPTVGKPGVLYIGDVGWNTTEELNIVRQGALNYGWPCFEGPYSQAAYQGVTSTAWPNPNVICSASLNSENPQAKTSPNLWWDHSNGANSNPPGLVGNCSVGGVFYTGTSYPPSYQNRYFHADYGAGWIKSIQVDTSDNVLGVSDFISGAGGIVDVEADPVTGDLYYIDINTSSIQRVRFFGGSLPPVVNATVNPTSGYVPLTVAVTASGSTDPGGFPLSFAWAFGDGFTSKKADTTYTYAIAGTYNASVTVSNGQGGTSIKTFQVVAGQLPPPGKIMLPIANSFFNQNQSLTLQATAVDTSVLSATYRWDVDLHHNDHFHPSGSVSTGVTSSFIPTTPNDGNQYSFRVRLSVTQGALTSYDTVNIYPRLNLTPVSVSFNPSAPPSDSAFQVIAKVMSVGEVGSSISTYQIFEGNSLLASGTLTPILNGDSLLVTTTVGPLSFGPHTIRFVADPANNLFETDESDNEASSVVTVAGLAAAYAFDEGSGTAVSDKSGNNLTGTIAGATWTSAGRYGKALSFNGNISYVDLGNPALLRTTGSMTWSAWVKANANPADDGQIIAKSDGTAGWQFKTTPDTGPETFGVAVSSASGVTVQRYSSTVRALNTWYYVAGVYNAATQSLDIYVNGILDNGILVGTVPASQFTSNVNANVGCRTGGFFFDGIIDEARVYNRALTQAEIQADMISPLSALRLGERVFLEGPYNAPADTMTNLLKTGGHLAAHFPGTPIPSKAVDSINIEIRDSLSAAKSNIRKFAPAWLLTDGSIRMFSDTTRNYVEFDTTGGSYYVVVRHRNHLAIMSARRVTLAAVPSFYDFSTAQSQAYGMSPMRPLGTRYVLWGGDCNGSGSNTATDRLAWQTSNGTAGYKGADLNLSGVVTASDRLLWQSNNGRTTQMP